jgi:hypothetical protein
MDGIYAKDMLDAVLAVVQSIIDDASYEHVLLLIADAMPRKRVDHALRTLDDAIKDGAAISIRDGQLVLTDAGRARIAQKRCPEGLPQAVVTKAYARENSQAQRPYTLKEQHILAILASYDDPLRASEILDEWERRQGTRPKLNSIIAGLCEDEAIAVASSSDDTEPAYVITNDGMDRYEDALNLLIPRALLGKQRPPMFLAYADIRLSAGEPILGSSRVPHRVRESIEQAALSLIGELKEAAESFDSDDADSMVDVLPQFFMEKYDQAFLEKFVGVVEDILVRLKTESDFSARSVAEALAMRDIMHHAKEYLATNNMSGLRPPSQRESRFFIYIDSKIFNDRFFEMLFNDLSTTIYAVEAEGNPNLPDLSFANWFEPFSDKQKRINARDRSAAQDWLAKMERDIRSSRAAALTESTDTLGEVKDEGTTAA